MLVSWKYSEAVFDVLEGNRKNLKDILRSEGQNSIIQKYELIIIYSQELFNSCIISYLALTLHWWEMNMHMNTFIGENKI